MATTKNSSANLSNIVRFDFDYIAQLPTQVKIVNDANNVGYVIIRHQLLGSGLRAQFTSKRYYSDHNTTILERLQAKCLYYLTHLNTCVACGDTPTPKAAFMKSFES